MGYGRGCIQKCLYLWHTEPGYNVKHAVIVISFSTVRLRRRGSRRGALNWTWENSKPTSPKAIMPEMSFELQQSGAVTLCCPCSWKAILNTFKGQAGLTSLPLYLSREGLLVRVARILVQASELENDTGTFRNYCNRAPNRERNCSHSEQTGPALKFNAEEKMKTSCVNCHLSECFTLFLDSNAFQRLTIHPAIR